MEQGKLIKWNDEKGFGFIRPDNSNEEIFVHISALQNAVRRPLVGDTVFFRIGSDNKGRRRAVEVGIQGAKAVFSERPINPQPTKHSRQLPPKSRYRPVKTYSKNWSRSPMLALLILLGIFVFDKLRSSNFNSNLSADTVDSPLLEEPAAEIATHFTCAGKTHCSEMTSCAEAKFYLNHCPGSVSDGDNDGIPCEDQWCGH